MLNYQTINIPTWRDNLDSTWSEAHLKLILYNLYYDEFIIILYNLYYDESETKYAIINVWSEAHLKLILYNLYQAWGQIHEYLYLAVFKYYF